MYLACELQSFPSAGERSASYWFTKLLISVRFDLRRDLLTRELHIGADSNRFGSNHYFEFTGRGRYGASRKPSMIVFVCKCHLGSQKSLWKPSELRKVAGIFDAIPTVDHW